MPQTPKLTKREIGFAVAMGALAAGAGTIWISESRDQEVMVAATENHRDFQVGQFDKLSTVGPQDVVITQGSSFSVRAEGSPEAIARLDAVVKDGGLVIGPRKDVGGFNWGRLSGATFYVTVPKLDAIAVAGSGSVRMDRVEGASFTGNVAGPGELSIRSMKVDRADFSVAGPGSLTASGTAGDVHASIAGSGDVDGNGLASDTATVSIGGSGDAALKVKRRASVSIMGSGDVEITGGATCSVSKMGSGDVSCNGEEVER